MNIQELLDKCEYAYNLKDFKKLIKLCDEVLKKDPENQIAISYKSISYCFLNQPEKALKILKEASKIYPNNYYHKNIQAMAYYDLGEYEKSLQCCEEGLKIKEFDWLCENKIRALLKLDRTEEAIEFYEDSSYFLEICDLMIDAGKYRQAFNYCLYAEWDDYESIIDRIKEKNPNAVGEYYLKWIYTIKSKSDIRFCPDCGGDLIPVVWGYPGSSLLDEAERGEIYLGGCEPLPYNYHCKKCGHEFLLGHKGLNIECWDDQLNYYIEYKIDEIASRLKSHSTVFIKSLDTLKKELKGFDDEEFNAFINHLINLEYLYKPREGYIKLVGYDDLKCAKEYLDEGKFAAPKWLVYPELSAWTIGWRMGYGEHYAMNQPHHSKEYWELFPMPEYWSFDFSGSPYRPHPLIGYFWTEDGKPKYPNSSDGIEVNDFITLDQIGEFQSDTFHFKSIEHAVLLSKYLYFEKCSRKEDLDALKEGFKLTSDEENKWDIYKYSVLLNAAYFKVMQDPALKQKLLETGNEPLIYVSDDEENLFGRALMELRDEIRRLCKNEDKIDWEYTEYLKYKPWGY